MSPTMQDFYLARAADCRRDAQAAPLANVRDRFLTSEATWLQLATRAARVATLHAGLIAEKAAARASIAAPAAAA